MDCPLELSRIKFAITEVPKILLKKVVGQGSSQLPCLNPMFAMFMWMEIHTGRTSARFPSS